MRHFAMFLECLADAQQCPPHPQAKNILARRLVHRCFKDWRAQCWERQWKVQLAIKDKQLQLLASEVSCVELVRHLVVCGPRARQVRVCENQVGKGTWRE